MMKLNTSMILGGSIIVSSLILGILLGPGVQLEGTTSSNEAIKRDTGISPVFTLQEAASYLRTTPENIKHIIAIERGMLDKSGHFRGVMFPYYKLDDTYYFHKPALDRWLEDVMRDSRQYDTHAFIMFR